MPRREVIKCRAEREYDAAPGPEKMPRLEVMKSCAGTLKKTEKNVQFFLNPKETRKK